MNDPIIPLNLIFNTFCVFVRCAAPGARSTLTPSVAEPLKIFYGDPFGDIFVLHWGGQGSGASSFTFSLDPGLDLGQIFPFYNNQIFPLENNQIIPSCNNEIFPL